MIEFKYKPVETSKIEVNGNIQEIYGIKTAKSFRGYMQGRINYFSNKDKQTEMMLRAILGVYDKFHPESKIDVNIESWKGKSGIQIIEYPEYFDCIEFRKHDEFNEPKELHHKLYKTAFNSVYKAFQSIKIGDRYKTSDFAEIWARINHIWENADGNKIIDNNGFNFANISGCRQTYFEFYYSIKVLEKHYLAVRYEKAGYITKIKEDLIWK